MHAALGPSEAWLRGRGRAAALRRPGWLVELLPPARVGGQQAPPLVALAARLKSRECEVLLS